MRVLRVALLLATSCTVSAQGPASKTVVVDDMNTSAASCDDFFDYANGAWRAQNPIPASMPRWSRRWKAGEANKEALKEILDGAAGQTNHPKGSIEQLIGDFYGACMDESRVNQLGVTPLRPLL